MSSEVAESNGIVAVREQPCPAVAGWLLEREEEAVGVARREVGGWLAGRGVGGEGVERAVLVVSELATNAVRYGGWRRFFVEARVGASAVRVLVWDASRELPVRYSAGSVSSEDEGGRGLLLVERLSEAWGVEYAPEGGKWVWARVRYR